VSHPPSQNVCLLGRFESSRTVPPCPARLIPSILRIEPTWQEVVAKARCSRVSTRLTRFQNGGIIRALSLQEAQTHPSGPPRDSLFLPPRNLSGRRTHFLAFPCPIPIPPDLRILVPAATSFKPDLRSFFPISPAPAGDPRHVNDASSPSAIASLSLVTPEFFFSKIFS